MVFILCSLLCSCLSIKRLHFTISHSIDHKNDNNIKNRMHILLTAIGRVQGVKRFEDVLCAPISSVETADSIGNTIQLKHTRTRI